MSATTPRSDMLLAGASGLSPSMGSVFEESRAASAAAGRDRKAYGHDELFIGFFKSDHGWDVQDRMWQ